MNLQSTINKVSSSQEQYLTVAGDLLLGINNRGDCQGHSHPKLLVALGEGSKSSADNIQPTAHRYPDYRQYSGVVPWPLNNDGWCCVKPRSVRT